MLKINNSTESNIDFDLPAKEEPQLQRNDEWFEKRRGCWTGSRIKNIMGCNPKGSKMSWADKDKSYEFSKGVLKYVYSRAMERQTKRYIETAGGPAMKYGTKVEPYILKIGEQLIGQPIDDVGFKEHSVIPTLGASSDGITQDRKMVAEIKACVTWETHYDRTFDPVNEKSTDFWQTQLEMMVWNVDKCAYLIAEPPNNIFDYLNEVKTFEDFKKECGISVEYVKASKFHQDAILTRVQIVEKACEAWLENGGNLAEIFWEIVDYYKQNNKPEMPITEVKNDSANELSVKDHVDQLNHIKHVRTIEKPNTNLEDLPF